MSHMVLFHLEKAIPIYNIIIKTGQHPILKIFKILKLKWLLKFYAKRTPSVIPVSLLDHMAILYLDEHRGDNAIELTLLAIKEHPTSGRVWRNLAFIYEKLSMQKEALAALEQALSTAISNKHSASSITSHKKALAEFKAKQR